METIETHCTPAAEAKSLQILLMEGLLYGFADPRESQLSGLFNRVSQPPRTIWECRNERKTCLVESAAPRRDGWLTLGPSSFIVETNCDCCLILHCLLGTLLKGPLSPIPSTTGMNICLCDWNPPYRHPRCILATPESPTNAD